MNCGHLLLAIVLLALSNVRRAEADVIFIDDTTDNLTATVFRNGRPIPIRILPDSNGEFLHFTFLSLFPAANTDTVSRDLLNPFGSDDTPGSLSDRFLLSFHQGRRLNEVFFASDPARIPLGHTVFPPLFETGSPQLVLETFFVNNGRLADQYFVASDVGGAASRDTPEPATWALLVAAMIPLLVRRHLPAGFDKAPVVSRGNRRAFGRSVRL
jgi:hypothetical protein